MALVKCEHCGQMISDKAEACPKCGNSLATKIVKPTTTQKQNRISTKRISAKWIFAIFVVVVIAFGLGLYFHTYIPFSKENNFTPTETEVSNASKDGGSGGQTNTHEICISDAECGYYLPSSKVAKYTADNLIDGNIKTAWAVNLDSPIYDCDALFGPIFTVNCSKVSEVEIVNGYGKDEASFFNNTRAAWVTVYRLDYMVEEFPNESDIIFRGKLKDTVEPQSLVVSPNFDNSKPTNKIGLIFSTKNSDGYYFGQKWNDLCISEFKVYGNSIATGKLEANEQLAINGEPNRRLEERSTEEWCSVTSRSDLKNKLNGTIWETTSSYSTTGLYYKFEINSNSVTMRSARPTRNYDDAKDWGDGFSMIIDDIAEPKEGLYCVICKAVDENDARGAVPTILVFHGKTAFYSLGGDKGPSLKKIN